MPCTDPGTNGEADLRAGGRLITGQLQPCQPGTHHYRGETRSQLGPHLSSLSAGPTPPGLPRNHASEGLSEHSARGSTDCGTARRLGSVVVFLSLKLVCTLRPTRCRDGGLWLVRDGAFSGSQQSSHLVPAVQREGTAWF